MQTKIRKKKVKNLHILGLKVKHTQLCQIADLERRKRRMDR